LKLPHCLVAIYLVEKTSRYNVITWLHYTGMNNHIVCIISILQNTTVYKDYSKLPIIQANDGEKTHK
jgi:hypothetical protein